MAGSSVYPDGLMACLPRPGHTHSLVLDVDSGIMDSESNWHQGFGRVLHRQVGSDFLLGTRAGPVRVSEMEDAEASDAHLFLCHLASLTQE